MFSDSPACRAVLALLVKGAFTDVWRSERTFQVGGLLVLHAGIDLRSPRRGGSTTPGRASLPSAETRFSKGADSVHGRQNIWNPAKVPNTVQHCCNRTSYPPQDPRGWEDGLCFLGISSYNSPDAAFGTVRAVAPPILPPTLIAAAG